VHWIGGVAMVTTIVLPRARALADARTALSLFESFEGRFAAQARVSIFLAGLSGFYMLHKMQGWARLLDPGSWWLTLMVAVWTVGIGAEERLFGNWTCKFEYLYADLGRINTMGIFPTGNVSANAVPIQVNLSSKITDNILRVGLNYLY